MSPAWLPWPFRVVAFAETVMTTYGFEADPVLWQIVIFPEGRSSRPPFPREPECEESPAPRRSSSRPAPASAGLPPRPRLSLDCAEPPPPALSPRAGFERLSWPPLSPSLPPLPPALPERGLLALPACGTLSGRGGLTAGELCGPGPFAGCPDAPAPPAWCAGAFSAFPGAFSAFPGAFCDFPGAGGMLCAPGTCSASLANAVAVEAPSARTTTRTAPKREPNGVDEPCAEAGGCAAAQRFLPSRAIAAVTPRVGISAGVAVDPA